jgi:hypothetical protein
MMALPLYHLLGALPSTSLALHYLPAACPNRPPLMCRLVLRPVPTPPAATPHQSAPTHPHLLPQPAPSTP